MSDRLASRQLLYNAMSEAELFENVRDYCAQGGWWMYHTHDSRKSTPGWPDVVALRSGCMIVAELKRQREQPTTDQTRVIGLLRDVVDQVRGLARLAGIGAGTLDLPVQVFVWRPSDLPDIQQILLSPPHRWASPG